MFVQINFISSIVVDWLVNSCCVSISEKPPSHESWDVKSIGEYTCKQFHTDLNSRMVGINNHYDISVSLRLVARNDDELLVPNPIGYKNESI